MRKVLGIETSCDETAASVVASTTSAGPHPVQCRAASQIEDHAALAAWCRKSPRGRMSRLLDGIDEGRWTTRVTRLTASTPSRDRRPGLIGGLIVGTMTAKAMAAASGKPLIPVNHLEGHALTARLTDGLAFPYLLLLVSGGHTQILLVEGVGRYRRWATTIDDALGEAFDKTAKLLGLPYPGGPNVERAAIERRPGASIFPTAEGQPAPRFLLLRPQDGGAPGRDLARAAERQDVADICASFQRAVTRDAARARGRSLDRFCASIPASPAPTLVVAGGVAANGAIRSALEALCRERGARLVAPPLELCTDNAAMIAWAGLERLNAGLVPEDAMALAPRARWPLDETPRRSASDRANGGPRHERQGSRWSAEAPGARHWH
jgi:N6-L-threonylcarbamoyladenine synthase